MTGSIPEPLIKDVNYKATLPSVKEERYKSLEELAIFLSLDPDRWIFRRFEKLRIANALRLQSHLNELEAEWDALMEYSGHIVQTKRLDQLNVEIQQTLTAYDACLVELDRQKTFLKPDTRHLDYLLDTAEKTDVNYKWHDKLGLHKLSYIESRSKTLFCPGSIPKGFIHKLIDKRMSKDAILAKAFGAKLPTHEDNTIQYSESVIRQVEQTIVALIFGLILITPVMALPFIPSKGWKLFFIGMFLILAIVIHSTIAVHVDRGSLAALAAYCAILAAFLTSK